MEGGLLDSGQGEEREQKKGYLIVIEKVQKPSAAAAAGARELQAGGIHLQAAAAGAWELQAGGWYSLGSSEVVDMMKKVLKPSAAAAAGARELQAGGSYSLGSGEGMDMKEKVQKPSAACSSTKLVLAFLVLTIAYAFLVLYVTETYTHSWMEKLQMLPLCIVAVTPPMLWAIMFRKFHG